MTYSKYLSGYGPIALNYGLHLNESDLSVYFRDYRVPGGPQGTQVVDIRLSTSGTVPVDAQRLSWFDGSGLKVSITDGESGVAVKGEVGQVDIARFAGRNVELSFTSIGFSHEHVLDVTGFTLIPEPTVSSLISCGLAVVVTSIVVRRKVR